MAPRPAVPLPAPVSPAGRSHRRLLRCSALGVLEFDAAGKLLRALGRPGRFRLAGGALPRRRWLHLA